MKITKQTIRLTDSDNETLAVSIEVDAEGVIVKLSLENCMVGVSDNPVTGALEDAILSITYIPDPEAIYKLRDFLNSALPDRGKQSNIKPLLTRSVSDLEFTVRTANRLKVEGIYTIDQLLKLSEQDIFRIPNMGRRCVEEIKNALSLYGLSLK